LEPGGVVRENPVFIETVKVVVFMVDHGQHHSLSDSMSWQEGGWQPGSPIKLAVSPKRKKPKASMHS
jgi:hypothetical protein